MGAMYLRFTRNESGQVLIIVAILVPLILAIGAIVVDLGNFYEHRRHLQTQVDAAALAGGGSWQFPCSPTVDAEIERKALQYAGAHNADTHITESSPLPTLNNQVGTTAKNDVHITLNSSYWNSSSPPPDYTTPPGTVCNALVLDVKATETNTAAFFGLIRPDLTAKARVEVLDASGAEKSLPFAIESPASTPCAWAIFVNESSGNVIGSPISMSRLTGDPLTWEIPASTTQVAPAAGSGLGVRFRLGDCSNSNRQDVYSIDGTNNGANNSSSGLGLVFAQTYDANWFTGTDDPEQAAFLGPVTLFPVSQCADGNYVSTTTATNSTCTVDVRASVDFHSLAGGVVEARIDGGGWVDLPRIPGVDVYQGGAFAIAAKSGRHTFDVRWARTAGKLCPGNAANCSVPQQQDCKSPPFGGGRNANPCQWGPVTVQKSFSAVVDKSGPILDAKILSGLEKNAVVGGGYLPGVRITLAGLKLGTRGDDPLVVRTSVQNSDNRSGALRCVGPNFRDDIINGCSGYTENVRVSPPLVCSPVLDPRDCIEANPGNKSGQLKQGMDTRFDCNEHNYWRDGVSKIQQGDPRIATVFITSYGSLSRDNNNPQTEVPIVSFASFYIVGWDGDSGCPENDPYPLSGSDAESVWGHFIATTIAPSGGTPGRKPCNPNSPNTCIVTLVE